MRYVAIDIGAESGRAIVGDLRDGRLTLKESHRFANGGIQVGHSMYWDILGLWREIKTGFRLAVQSGEISSIGIDTWGVDYALLDANGELLSNPYCYRDTRTDGLMARLCEQLGRDTIFNNSGIQFMPINTLYQLVAENTHTPNKLVQAKRLLMIPDLLHYWLTGVAANEYTIATTTQAFNTKTRQWSASLLDRIGVPTSLFGDVVMPGTVLGNLSAEVADEVGAHGVRVILPGTHDTASAVAAVPFERGAGVRAYISSGTWSLIGVEVPEPVINPDVLAANMTNEGGVGGRIRMLKNVMGMWLIQQCRLSWTRHGHTYSYDQLAHMATEASEFDSVFDPDHESLMHPADMPTAIADLCNALGQKAPSTPGEYARCIYSSLAHTYKRVIAQASGLIGKPIEAIHIVGGGSQATFLNQMTADVCGMPVLAGPVECTAIGNVLTQAMGTGEIGSLDDLRAVVRNSFVIVRYVPC
jgi:rhamnulokinase